MQQYAFEQIVRALDRPEAQPVIGAAHGEKFDAHADGELVILDDEGCPQWERLQKRHVIKHPQRIRRASVEDPAAIFAFDLLWLDGADFRRRTLLERKDTLHRLLPANRRVRYARHMNDSSAEIWQLAVQMELEGILAKDAGSIIASSPPKLISRLPPRAAFFCGLIVRLDASAFACLG